MPNCDLFFGHSVFSRQMPLTSPYKAMQGNCLETMLSTQFVKWRLPCPSRNIVSYIHQPWVEKFDNENSSQLTRDLKHKG